jgi:hypothetical protein
MAINTTPQSVLNKARDDKFLLVFDVPPILKTISSPIQGRRDNKTIIPETVQFSIFGTMVPEVTVPAIENRYVGNTLYVSSHSKNSYPPVSVKFNVDNQYNNYWTIYQWLNFLHDEKQGRYNPRGIEVDENFSDYQTDLTIYGLDEYNNKRIKFTYTKAFPTTINGVEYNYQNGGEIVSGFTFVYSQLHTELLNI